MRSTSKVRAEARDKLESQGAHIIHGNVLHITVTELRELGSRTINLCLEVNAARQCGAVCLFSDFVVSLSRHITLVLSHSQHVPCALRLCCLLSSSVHASGTSGTT